MSWLSDRTGLTEHGIESAEPLHIQETEPCTLTVRVITATKDTKDTKDSTEANA